MPDISINAAADGVPICLIWSAGSFMLFPFFSTSRTVRSRPFVWISSAFKYSFPEKTRRSSIEPSFSISLDTAELSLAATVGGFEPGGGGGPSTIVRPRLTASTGPTGCELTSDETALGSVGIPAIFGTSADAEFEFPFETTPGAEFEFAAPLCDEFALEFVSGADPQAPSKIQVKITLRYFIAYR